MKDIKHVWKIYNQQKHKSNNVQHAIKFNRSVIVIESANIVYIYIHLCNFFVRIIEFREISQTKVTENRIENFDPCMNVENQ